jgi:hypothetical protein
MEESIGPDNFRGTEGDSMVRYVKNIDELVELVDREFSGGNALCPLCKKTIGTVNIQDAELGLPELKFMQFKHPGIFCTEGHCVISLEDKDAEEELKASGEGEYHLHIEDLGIKVFEVMKMIKPYLDIDESLPNSQLYWMFMKGSERILTKGLNREQALELLDRLQKLGARAFIV